MRKKLAWETNEDGCHICTSHYIDRQGYPLIRRGKERMHASRYVFEEINGILPRHVVIRHKCDNPTCINPDHLETGTVKQNVQDRMRSGTYQSGERNPNVKLSQEDVSNIRQQYKNGDGPRLAKRYGVSASAINRIVLRKSWAAIAAAKAKLEGEA